MLLSKKEARERVCIAVSSQLNDTSIFDLLEKREAGDDVTYDSLGLDDEGKTALVRPLTVVFKDYSLRWGVAEVRNLPSIAATEARALSKSQSAKD